MTVIGIDVGGTFTDLVALDEATGRITIAKAPTTPGDQSRGILDGLDALDVALERIDTIAHGTTVATNTVLERNGARLAVVTTRGFRDVVHVGKGNRTAMYDFRAVRAPPIAPRALTFEVTERVRFDGSVATALNEAELAEVIDRLVAVGVDAVAVCFLHAYANPAHEVRARDLILARAPAIHVSTSHDVLPEMREFERFATTVLNAYVAPRVGRYLGSFGEALATRGHGSGFSVMTSGGGVWSAARMARFPVNSMLSGPAAGVMGAAYLSRTTEHRNLITYDMGGTSTDCCLIVEGDFERTGDGRVAGLPNRVQQIDINAVGSGGGSIAYLEAGAFLKVGPRSAGALPGPACYGRGGIEPTVTDANLILGRLDPSARLAGGIALDRGRARSALATIAEPLGLDIEQAAEGVIAIAAAQTTSAIKEISIMRGFDPRDFALLAFGGAGPMHAAQVAAELEMTRVIVPQLPGNFSAFGLLVADVRHEAARSWRRLIEGLSDDELDDQVADLRLEAVARARDDGLAPSDIEVSIRLDMRYVGQAFELAVTPPRGNLTPGAALLAFKSTYERRYGAAPDQPVEITCIRVSAAAPDRARRLVGETGGHSRDFVPTGVTTSIFSGRAYETPVFSRDDLPIGQRRMGPALIVELGATTVVPPGFSMGIDASSCLILEAEAGASP